MYRCMIIDDEPLALSSIARFIEEHFQDCIQVSAYEDSSEALCAFKQNPSDIVLTDIRMPSISGIELLEQMQAVSRNFVPIIFSSFSEFSYAKKAIRLGVIYYLEKPLDFDELSESLHVAIHNLMKQKIIQQKNASQREAEISFFNNISNNSLNEEKIASEFASLSFPFSLKHSDGIQLQIHVNEKISSYHYDEETFSYVLENLIRIFLKPQYVCTVQHSPNYYKLLLIGCEISQDRLVKLENEVEELIGLKIDAKQHIHFSSLTELASAKTQMNSISVSSDNIKNNNRQAIQLALSYIQQHYAEDLSREKVASIVYMSVPYFSRQFKQQTGQSFLDYLMELRMQKAIELLHTNMKIQDIAKAVGFSSGNRFYIYFKNFTSYSPIEYRRSILKLNV